MGRQTHDDRFVNGWYSPAATTLVLSGDEAHDDRLANGWYSLVLLVRIPGPS